ncbi:hypothetical protein Glove_633g6 [Diversispora epigaea]|uniref:BTB domain-containing protein n=1 Tax=Diversispora epigaea TaxID=1348612 RepID=A0A397G517_9GLOM|nr:hypothetical protein Glove_633g6 [Diversispora epigaea]
MSQLKLGKYESTKFFEVHSYALQSRCPYFRKKLNTSVNKNNVKVSIKFNISVKAFNVIIKLRWDYVIQWGRSKNPTLPANLNEWTSDNFITLKTTLKNCFPHVRYFNISSERVLEKLWPYLWLDINTKLLAPEKPISSIILPPQKILIDEFVYQSEKETTYIENNPYEFKFLSEQVEVKIFVINRVTRFDNAIYSGPDNSWLQSGNALNLGGDLKTEKKSYCDITTGSAYEKSIQSNPNCFSVEEFEVFEAIQNFVEKRDEKEEWRHE